MTEAIATKGLDDATMLLLVAGGDTARLSPAQKLAYYNARCEAAGLDPRAQPFEFIKLGSKEQLYARKAATDQLASKHGIRVEIVSQTTEHEIRVVTVRAIAKDGRQTDEIGAVPVKGLVGEILANAMMKAVTKAKRRAILSLCGLGMMDETEVETIPSVVQTTSVEAARILALAEPDKTQRAAEEIVKQVEAVTAQQVPDHVKPLFDDLLRQSDPKGPGGTHDAAQVKYAMDLIEANAQDMNIGKSMNAWTVTQVNLLRKRLGLAPPQRHP